MTDIQSAFNMLKAKGVVFREDSKPKEDEAFRGPKIEQGPVICTYCGNETELVSGKEIYKHRPDLADLPFYMCRPCDARVGCHPYTKIPLGTVANEKLRNARHSVHQVLDPLWRSKKNTRNQVYTWLSEKMGIEKDQCHIGMFNLDQCAKALIHINKRPK